MHRMERANKIKLWRQDFYVQATVDGIPDMPPCRVRAIQHCKTHRSLPDVGACYEVVKAAIDGLVDAGVWPDDDHRWVLSIEMVVPVVDGVDSLELQLHPI